jgi:hypothetical protein
MLSTTANTHSEQTIVIEYRLIDARRQSERGVHN